MSLGEFTKYIKLHNAQLEQGATTDPKVVQSIHDAFFSAHPDAPSDRMNYLWHDVVGPMVEQNAALAQFILDYGGAESDFFFPWLDTIRKSPSKALEMAYGFGYNLNGGWGIVPQDDNIDVFVRNVPTFVYNRERQLFMANLVTEIADRSSEVWRDKNGEEQWSPTTVVDLGAGCMAWGKYHGFKFNYDQTIIAVDKDPSINPKRLFGNSPLITYSQTDIVPWLASHQHCNVDLVMLGGVASYYPLDSFVKSIVEPVYKILKPGGAFFFDLQLDCPQYEWTIKLFGWPEMKLAHTAAEAIDNVETIRRLLWQNGIKFGASYTVDTYNESPSAVMIVMNKI